MKVCSKVIGICVPGFPPNNLNLFGYHHVHQASLKGEFTRDRILINDDGAGN